MTPVQFSHLASGMLLATGAVHPCNNSINTSNETTSATALDADIEFVAKVEQELDLQDEALQAQLAQLHSQLESGCLDVVDPLLVGKFNIWQKTGIVYCGRKL